MLDENSTLWTSIRDFRFDKEADEIIYSRKLSFENNWDYGFTQNVIKEYKKFIYLCAISEKPLSPSPVVDKAWHLHLTYTKSYWEDLCNGILKKSIHHNPSGGTAGETVYHDNLYLSTLDFYSQVFGYTPPADIWPASMERFRNSKKFSLRKLIGTAGADSHIIAKLISLVLLLAIVSFLVYIIFAGKDEFGEVPPVEQSRVEEQAREFDLMNFIENNPGKILVGIVMLSIFLFYIFFKSYMEGGGGGIGQGGSCYGISGCATSCAACGSECGSG